MKKSFWGCLSGSNGILTSVAYVRYIGNRISLYQELLAGSRFQEPKFVILGTLWDVGFVR